MAKPKPPTPKSRKAKAPQTPAEMTGGVPEFLERDENNKLKNPKAKPPAADPSLKMEEGAAEKIAAEHAAKHKPIVKLEGDANEQLDRSNRSQKPFPADHADATKPYTVFSEARPVNPPPGTGWVSSEGGKRWNGKLWVEDASLKPRDPPVVSTNDKRPAKEQTATRVKTPKGNGLTSKVGEVAEAVLKNWNTKAEVVAALVKATDCEEYAASNVVGVWISTQNRAGRVEKKEAGEGKRGKVYKMAGKK